MVKEAQVQIGKVQKRQALYYNMRRRELEIKMGDFVLFDKHWRQKNVAKFFGPFKACHEINNNLVTDVDGERMTVNLDQVRVYKFREDVSEGSQMLRGIS